MAERSLSTEQFPELKPLERAPRDAFGPAIPDPRNNQVLELCDLNRDLSQTSDPTS